MADYSNITNNRKVQLVVVVALLALALIFLRDLNPATVDLKLGIEFVGGVRIPVTLERSVDQATMTTIVDQIKQRINKFGLSQAVVRPVGDREVLVEIPQAEDNAIESVQRLLREEGKFEAIIDGAVALEGKDVISASVGGITESVHANPGGGYSWEIGFTATTEGGARFTQAALGKANYPVFMFLDRPSNATIVADRSWFNASTNPATLDRAVREALSKQGDDINLLFEDELGTPQAAETLKGTKTVIAPLGGKARELLEKQGFSTEPNASRKLVLREVAEVRPTTYLTDKGELTVSEWPAIGLISGPTLSPELADGQAKSLPSYRITGSGTGGNPDEQKASAINELKIMKIVLTQGKLPVSTVIGSTYSISPSLGKQFFIYSALGILLAVSIVALLIILRYRSLVLAVPIVLVNAIEMLVTLAIVGSFTLDLAAMAGIITLIGTGVDDQIIITDELLHKKKKDGEEEEPLEAAGVKQRIGKAFEIIMTNATVAIVAMLPLLVSGIVEITGFALAYVIGVLVGVFLTRPAYAVIVGELFKKK
ncbi:MAG: MMPL family transporter [Candidatus Micrarchaeota archaeon]